MACGQRAPYTSRQLVRATRPGQARDVLSGALRVRAAQLRPLAFDAGATLLR